ncbi:MAG TPA: nickel-dependent hydrogenase large subunit, partial [Xanthobacteraceae bacterium]|nr:nickel-dependent hydrogenase large subunit [Xanthobacteraceae bacterium]
MPLAEFLLKGRLIESHRPWPRVTVTADVWQGIANELAAGRATLLGLWGDNPPAAHMAIMSDDARQITVVTIECPGDSFPSVGAVHPPAIRLERAIFSLYGLEPMDVPDARPWLDLGRWDVRYPLGARESAPAPASPYAYPFLAVEGESLHQIPVGPVHAGIIEPGHFRFTAGGETVVRLEERLGYVHKGIESLMAGATIDRASRLAARTSGDSTVAYGIAFARAVEAALGVEAPPRAQYIRALMAELERLANHLGDIGAICNDASFALMHAHCGILRERVLRAAAASFGHRLMMDRVVPGGVMADLDAAGATAIRDALQEIRQRFPRLVELYDNTASLQDRTVGTGIVTAALARQFSPGGYVGRASGRNFDARKVPGYPPYDEIDFEVPVFTAGDVDARVWVRIREVEQSLHLIEQILARLPEGPIATAL